MRCSLFEAEDAALIIFGQTLLTDLGLITCFARFLLHALAYLRWASVD